MICSRYKLASYSILVPAQKANIMVKVSLSVRASTKSCLFFIWTSESLPLPSLVQFQRLKRFFVIKRPSTSNKNLSLWHHPPSLSVLSYGHWNLLTTWLYLGRRTFAWVLIFYLAACWYMNWLPLSFIGLIFNSWIFHRKVGYSHELIWPAKFL